MQRMEEQYEARETGENPGMGKPIEYGGGGVNLLAYSLDAWR